MSSFPHGFISLSTPDRYDAMKVGTKLGFGLMHGKKSISPDLDSGGKLAQIYTNMTKIDLEIKTNLNIQIQFFCYNWNKGKWAIFIKPKPPSG